MAKNNKGRVAGSGTVTNTRKEAFKKKGMARENTNMALEDALAKGIDWEADKALGKNRKPHLLTAWELKYCLASKEQKADMEEEKKKKEEEGRASFDKKEEQDEEPSLLPRVVKEKGVGEENKEASLAKREASLLPREEKGKEASHSLDKSGVSKEPSLDKSGGTKEPPLSLDKSRGNKQPGGSPLLTKVGAQKGLPLTKVGGNKQPPLEEPSLDESGTGSSLDKKEKPNKILGPSQQQYQKEKSQPSKPSDPELEMGPDWGASSTTTTSPSPTSPSPATPPPPPEEQQNKTNPLAKRAKTQPAQKWVLKEKPKKKVAVDWHNTLEVKETVSAANINALDQLKKEGYEVYLCSFGGHNRNWYTDKHSGIIWDGWAGKFFTSSPTGWYGKADALCKHGIDTIFDDNYQVIEECDNWNIKVFPVVPSWKQKGWDKYKTWPTFAQAVEAFLRFEG